VWSHRVPYRQAAWNVEWISWSSEVIDIKQQHMQSTPVPRRDVDSGVIVSKRKLMTLETRVVRLETLQSRTQPKHNCFISVAIQLYFTCAVCLLRKFFPLLDALEDRVASPSSDGAAAADRSQTYCICDIEQYVYICILWSWRLTRTSGRMI